MYERLPLMRELSIASLRQLTEGEKKAWFYYPSVKNRCVVGEGFTPPVIHPYEPQYNCWVQGRVKTLPYRSEMGVSFVVGNAPTTLPPSKIGAL